MSPNHVKLFKPICAALMLLILPAAAWAQSEDKGINSSSEQARERFQRGTVAYSQGDYDLAIREWEAAYGMDPRPKIKYNVAQAYERLGKLNEAVAALERYIETAGSEDNQFLGDARVKLASLQARLASTGVTIHGGPEGASISVDGNAWGRTPRPDRIALQPGNHRIVVSLKGYRDFISDVAIPPGQVINVAVEMAPEKEGQTAAAPQPAAVQASPPPAAETNRQPAATKSSSGLGWFIAAGVLGGATVGSVIWFIDRNSAVNECSNTRSGKACLNESTVTSERTFALVATTVFGVGAIAAAVIGLVQSGGSEQEKPPATACAPSLTGVSCWTSF